MYRCTTHRRILYIMIYYRCVYTCVYMHFAFAFTFVFSFCIFAFDLFCIWCPQWQDMCTYIIILYLYILLYIYIYILFSSVQMMSMYPVIYTECAYIYTCIQTYVSTYNTFIYIYIYIYICTQKQQMYTFPCTEPEVCVAALF